MELYPANTVWYVEARPWQAGPGGKSGFAPVDPASRGTAVAIAFTRPNPAGGRQRQVYLLTCAHVVRDSADNLLADIVCYPPGSGYVRTQEKGRRSGEFPNAKAKIANVSAVSPCAGVRKARSEELQKDPAKDWVLLEIKDASIDHVPVVRGLATRKDAEGSEFPVLGYPFGAGLLAEKEEFEQQRLRGEYPSWQDGHLVSPRAAKSFRPQSDSPPGLIHYEGPEETKPGMSGGGVFLEERLLGIHRFHTDPTNTRGAVLLEAILEHLVHTHDFKFAPPALTLTENNGQRQVIRNGDRSEVQHSETETKDHETIHDHSASRDADVKPDLKKDATLPRSVGTVPVRLNTAWMRLNIGLIVVSVLLLSLWALRVLGVFSFTLIFSLASTVGVMKFLEIGFPKSGYGKLAKRIQAPLLRRSTSLVLTLVLCGGLLASFSGTMIHIASLPEGVEKAGIRWGQPPKTSHDTVAEGKSRWFWTFFGTTLVRFESPGFIPVEIRVSPWQSTTFHGMDQLKHRPFVIVKLKEPLDPSVPPEDVEEGFEWKLRVRSRPAGNPSADYETWTPCLKYYVGQPLVLGGDGSEWPRVEDLRALGIDPSRVVKPEACPLSVSGDRDYIVEVLDQNGEQVEYSVDLSREEVARIRSPILRELLRRR